MLFGSARIFAIEAELLEIHGQWTYGRLRSWVNGVPLGDFEDTSDLAASARWGRVFLAASPRRTRPDLDHLTSHEVFELLYGRFVQPVHSAPRKPLAGPWDREPYVLDEVGESALRDKVAIVVVRRADGSDRILANDYELQKLHEIAVPEGVCDQVIGSYCTWVERLRALTP